MNREMSESGILKVNFYWVNPSLPKGVERNHRISSKFISLPKTPSTSRKLSPPKSLTSSSSPSSHQVLFGDQAAIIFRYLTNLMLCSKENIIVRVNLKKKHMISNITSPNLSRSDPISFVSSVRVLQRGSAIVKSSYVPIPMNCVTHDGSFFDVMTGYHSDGSCFRMSLGYECNAKCQGWAQSQ